MVADHPPAPGRGRQDLDQLDQQQQRQQSPPAARADPQQLLEPAGADGQQHLVDEPFERRGTKVRCARRQPASSSTGRPRAGRRRRGVSRVHRSPGQLLDQQQTSPIGQPGHR
jgi:hypothetical protein